MNRDDRALRERIIGYLQTAEVQWQSTLQILKAVRGPTTSKKDVNRVLYALRGQDVVVHRSEDPSGAKPQWKLVHGEHLPYKTATATRETKALPMHDERQYAAARVGAQQESTTEEKKFLDRLINEK